MIRFFQKKLQVKLVRNMNLNHTILEIEASKLAHIGSWENKLAKFRISWHFVN